MSPHISTRHLGLSRDRVVFGGFSRTCNLREEIKLIGLFKMIDRSFVYSSQSCELFNAL